MSFVISYISRTRSSGFFAPLASGSSAFSGGSHHLRYTCRVAQTKHEIQSLLAEANSHPRHRFGQNFMIDGNLVRLVADAGEISAGDLVVEVGPGTGTLTEELLARGGDVVAVEIDRDLAAVL